ncbi:YdeI/OmpD-associated family protein [Hymenobacter cheonanensis]|uniref:YdeI/OmpD-associated family protein n=1 Tax=Hymenobacter sp. CA2-7 TaxID=3063993 RepID=UPI002713C9C8|nr:YdeI/OmpD-associated family protein [Hymenobacter sp. CA2-7]MDO7885267.1 YdeI/OmpD-associated family protein [Hymenobacter sp. CA2-7]
MTPEAEPETFCPASPQHWREWLQAHHAERQFIWLIYHKKNSATPSLTWSQAVDEALCFGWIDSRAQPLDAERYRQFFSRRKPGSGWSKVNKAKIERLIATGLMTPAGLASIEAAKQTGAWTLLDDIEELRIPADLAQQLQARPLAASYFESLSRTDKRNILQWLVLAKRPATRQKRLAEIVELAAQQLKPAQFRGRKSPS